MSEKTKAILAYVFSCVGGAIILYGMTNNSRNTKIHAAQSIVIGIGYAIIYVICSFIPIPMLFFTDVICVVLSIIGIIKACNEENPEIPVIGEIAMSMFDKKINE